MEADHFFRNVGSKFVELGFRDPTLLLALREKARIALSLPEDSTHYQPHITVGQVAQSEADAFVADLQNGWEPIRFRVREVCLMEQDKKGRYRPIARVPLVDGDDD